MAYVSHVSKFVTPQSEQARADQVENNAGGFVFALDKWAQFDRFLILGCESGSYYATERVMTRENATVVEVCLLDDGPRAVARIVEISDSGRAPKNDPAMFALALAMVSENVEARRAVVDALPKVCRTGTHLFTFTAAIGELRNWGTLVRRAVSSWYNGKTPEQVAFQAMKYAQRGKWSHRDVLRCAHVNAPTRAHESVYRWIVQGSDGLGQRFVQRRGRTARVYDAVGGHLPESVRVFEQLKKSRDPKEVVRLIRQHGFTHEMVPNEVKKSREVWEALLEKMPLHALLRQLGKLTNVGVVAPMSKGTKFVVDRLGDAEQLKKSRVHPVAILMTLLAYKEGHGTKGKLTWEPETAVVDALDAAFYAAFKHVEPTGKRRLIAIDISASMDGSQIAGNESLSARVAAAAMAMVTAKTESQYVAVGFTGDLTRIDLSSKRRLDDVVSAMQQMPMGRTDCSLPMQWAEEQKLEVDAIEIYTDNETWCGEIHPFQALRRYRRVTGLPVKLMVAAMTSTGFSIADPNDAGSLDVIGFDTATPALMADFIRTEIGKKKVA